MITTNPRKATTNGTTQRFLLFPAMTQPSPPLLRIADSRQETGTASTDSPRDIPVAPAGMKSLEYAQEVAMAQIAEVL
ncbi:MAG: hypothetical protein O7D35_02960, partial [Acidobacteria bacterium]|nr:hypothetical protein [Acidobacteriota bacterium]